VDEVIAEGRTKDGAGADLALIGAGQKVEHYEIAGYTTARNFAQQLKMPTNGKHTFYFRDASQLRTASRRWWDQKESEGRVSYAVEPIQT
jgi:hypothetical protein